MKNTITGPFQVIPEDLDYHNTLDTIDIGAWYLIINGSMQFFDSEKEANHMKDILKKLN